MQAILIILLINVILSCNSKPTQVNKPQLIVKRVFIMASNNDYDSLRNVIRLVRQESDSDMKIRFTSIKSIIKTEGMPTQDQLIERRFSNSENKICTITFLPNNSKTHSIDSIVFTFDRFNGLDKISTFEVYEHATLINPIKPLENN